MKVFVYGTLRKNKSNHHLIASETFVGEAKTSDKYMLFVPNCGLPMVSKDHAASQISGEVYDVSEAKLTELDKLENHPSWYRREEVDVLVGESKMRAWLYFIVATPAKGCLEESGDYGTYLARIQAIGSSMRMEGLKCPNEMVIEAVGKDQTLAQQVEELRAWGRI